MLGPEEPVKIRTDRTLLGLLRTATIVALLAVATALALSDRTPPPIAVVSAPPAAPVETAPRPEIPEGPPAVRAVPLGISVSAIRVDAEIVPVGILEGDVMEIPEDVATIGWYDPDGDLGVTPGSRGTAVFAGHVDSRSQGRGALYLLRDLRPDALIEVQMSDGTVQTWIVTEVVQYGKVALPYHEVFEWGGPPRLALITCGGEFDRTTRSYTDNIVAYARPIEPQPSVSG